MSEFDQEDKTTATTEDRGKDTSKLAPRRATRQQLKEQPRKKSPIPAAAGGGKTKTSHQSSAADAVTATDTRWRHCLSLRSFAFLFGRRDRPHYGSRSSVRPSVCRSELKISHLVLVQALRNVRTNFGFSAPFVLELEARTGQTDGRTDGRARPVLRTIRTAA